MGNCQGLGNHGPGEQERAGITSLLAPSFFTSSGSGFEAFFTAAGTLVVAVCTRKEYMTVSVPEVSFADSTWHCVAIVHVSGRRPFSQNLVNVFKDGHLVKTAPLRFPSLSEVCQAGFGRPWISWRDLDQCDLEPCVSSACTALKYIVWGVIMSWI